MFEAGGAALGLLATVGVDDSELEPDPFEPLREPGQHLVRRDIAPTEVVELREVPFGWQRWRMPLTGDVVAIPSLGRSAALADWAALNRVRDDDQDSWRPDTVNDARRDLDALGDLRRRGIGATEAGSERREGDSRARPDDS